MADSTTTTTATAASTAPSASATSTAEDTANQSAETTATTDKAEQETSDKKVSETKKPTSKERLHSRYRQSRPDLNWDDETVDNDLEGLAIDELEAFDKDRAARADMDAKMNKLFGSDSRASKVFVDWANGKDPIENLIESYGEDFLDALQSSEGKEKFKKSLESWRNGKKANEEHAKLYDANIAQTAKTLVSFADKNNLSDDQVKSIVEKAHQLASDALDGKYSEELLEMLYKAGKYEEAVSEAREEGRINGKNESIRRELRASKPKTSLPPTAGGQNATMSQNTPQKAKSGTLGFFGGIDVKKKS